MAHPKVEKTNAARLLDRAKIAYELVPYRVDEEHLAATHVAEQLGEDIATVFKTLVLKGDRTGYFVCVVPGDHEVDLKAAAKISANKKADLIPMKELLPVTGYIRRGLFADRHEKGLSDLHPRHGRRPAFHLCQCGGAGAATQGRPFGPGGLRPGDVRRDQPQRVGLINTEFFVVFSERSYRICFPPPQAETDPDSMPQP